MNNVETRDLCLALIRAESEDEAIATLEEAGLWESSDLWRFYGDDDGNYSTVGNQQSRPDAALIEKLVNSIDARLILECRLNGIDPSGPAAPNSIREAVAHFFDNADPSDNPVAGLVSEWSPKKRTDIARGITLAATGKKGGAGYPNFSIADQGEGQTPGTVPETFMSLHRTNKINIPFVQGKFNMGGTGVLQFCGKHNLQLVVTRRCPALLDEESPEDDHKWSFTVVRRELPTGNRRSSVYTYLAPLEADVNPRGGGVLRFAANSLPILPDGQEPYAHEAEWGSLIKLWEYEVTERGPMFLKNGLLERVDLLLPGAALPIRMHECRDYKGHAGSFETTVSGLRVRLDDNKGKNLEPGFPSSAPLRAGGMRMDVVVYAFQPKQAENYRKTEGIIFTVNGQTHGHLTLDFFRRKRAGRHDYLARSLLLIVNCDGIEGGDREDLFMNSRDRLRSGELRQQIERGLERILSDHSGLKELRERRRREEIQSRLEDEKPLQDVLESILKHSPTLSALFSTGKRLTSPFKTKEVAEREKPFEGKRYPSYFKFASLDYGRTLERDVNKNRRPRIRFETDAANDYFSRSIDQGSLDLTFIEDENGKVEEYSLNLHDGIATLNVELPDEVTAGQTLRYRTQVTDSTRVEPFVNDFTLHIKPPAKSSGGNGRRKNPPGNDSGSNRESNLALALPEIVLVNESEWEDQDPAFDQYTALRIKGTVEGGNGQETEVYDFFINMDNTYFKHELKYFKGSDDLLKAQWKYGLVLLGLGLIQEEHRTGDKAEAAETDSSGSVDLTETVDRMSRAVAPILLPMIDYLGDLDLDEITAEIAVGEAT